MLTYPIYKALKQQLNAVAPCFFFIGQYLQGKGNTSYRVPAIYIETPKDNKVNYFPRKQSVLLGAQFKIHVITYAPFKNEDTPVQDSQLALHETKVKQIDRMINGLVLKDQYGKLLTQQFVTVNISEMNFIYMCVITVLTYKTDVYSRHLQ